MVNRFVLFENGCMYALIILLSTDSVSCGAYEEAFPSLFVRQTDVH